MGTESLQSEVITESMSSAAAYKDILSYYQDKYGILVRTGVQMDVPQLFEDRVGVELDRINFYTLTVCVAESVSHTFDVCGAVRLQGEN